MEDMERLHVSWLSACIISPLVVVLSVCTLYVFSTYRSTWRVLDIFFFTVSTVEGVSALFIFGYSFLRTALPDLEGPCWFIIWGITATRFFHMTAVTSLILDRTFSAKWPKVYRASMSQVHYHIAVLATISSLVGVTSLVARNPLPSISCTLHPLKLDPKFSAFLFFVYVMLLLSGITACFILLVIQCKTSNGSILSCDCGSSGRSEIREVAWKAASIIYATCCLMNHLPYLVWSTMVMVDSTMRSPWMDNSLVWLQICQFFLTSFTLNYVYLPHRSALRNMLRTPGRIYRHLSDNGGFRMQIGDSAVAKPNFPPFPLHPGQMFPQRLRWSPTNLPSLQSLQPLDVDLLQRDSRYSSLLSFPSSSAYSSCSSTRQSLASVTTNAVDDFVFRRPSVLALFEPQSRKEDDDVRGRRCDTPTPFVKSPFYDFQIPDDFPHPPSDTDSISENMISIILSYEKGRIQEEASEADVSTNQSQEESEDLSSITSSESSDADSVQSVIIRQKVDQSGKVMESDIMIAERKIIKCSTDSEYGSLDSESWEKHLMY